MCFFAGRTHPTEHLSRNIRKHTIGHVRPANIQISLCGRSLIRIFTGLFLDSKGCRVSSCGLLRLWLIWIWLLRLIWISVGRTCQKVRFLTLRHNFSRCRSFTFPLTLLMDTFWDFVKRSDLFIYFKFKEHHFEFYGQHCYDHVEPVVL